MTKEPAIGRIVHYVARGSADGKFPPVHRAAVIAEIDADVEGNRLSDTVNLVVINPQGIFFDVVDHDEAKSPGTWHWPERVD